MYQKLSWNKVYFSNLLILKIIKSNAILEYNYHKSSYMPITQSNIKNYQ